MFEFKTKKTERRHSVAGAIVLFAFLGPASTALADPCAEVGVACFGDRLFVGWDRESEFTLSDGASDFSDVFIGFNFDSSVHVKDMGELRSNALTIGLLGDGALSLSGGAAVEVDEGQGEIALGGIRSGTINIGAEQGAVALAPGALQAERLFFGPGGGEIVFNHTAVGYDFDVDVIGASGILLLESGHTRPTGDLSSFMGELIVGNGLPGGSATLDFAGDSAAGDELTLGGDFTLRNGGELRINVDADGGSDRLDIGGTVDLAGDLQIVPVGHPSDYGAPGAELRYSIIEYDEEADLTGVFANIDSGFLEEEIVYYDPDGRGGYRVAVVLNLDRPDLTGDAVNQNTQIVAQAIADFDYSLAGGAVVFDGLQSLSDQQRVDALAQIGGFGQGEIFRQPQFLSRPFVETMFDRMSRDASRLSPENVTVSTSNRGMVPVENVWVMAFAENVARQGDADVPGIDAETVGFLVGTDMTLDADISVGAALGFSRTTSAAGTVDGEAQGYHLGLYGATGADSPFDIGLGARGAVFASSFEFNTVRTVSFGGLSGAAEGRFSGHGAGAEAIVRYGIGDDSDGHVIAPFAGLRYAQFTSAGYSEIGIPSLNLDASPYNSEQLTSILGLETGGVIDSRIGEVRYMLSVSWERALVSLSEDRTFLLEGSSAPMTFSTIRYERDRFGLAGSLAVDLSSRAVLELSGAATIANRAAGFGGGVTYRFEF